jgi:sugar phosphate isomerase/epimerase
MTSISVNPFSSVRQTFEQDLALWSALGFEHVGVSTAKTAGMVPAMVRSRLDDNGLTAAYVVHPLQAAVGDDTAWQKEVDQLLHSIDLADAVGASSVYFPSGSQGLLSWSWAARQLADRLAPVVDRARRSGVAVAVETVHSSRPELGFVHSVLDAIALAEQAGTTICLDLYVSWGDRGLSALAEQHLALITLVQVSDYRFGDLTQPARRVPGDGDLPLRTVVRELVAAGYTGSVDLELLGPDIEAEGYEAALRRGSAWLHETLAADHPLTGCIDNGPP